MYLYTRQVCAVLVLEKTAQLDGTQLLHLATAHAPKICLLRIQDVPHLEVLPYAQPAVPTKVD